MNDKCYMKMIITIMGVTSGVGIGLRIDYGLGGKVSHGQVSAQAVTYDERGHGGWEGRTSFCLCVYY